MTLIANERDESEVVAIQLRNEAFFCRIPVSAGSSLFCFRIVAIRK
jgi:hypothetical protein